MHAARACCWCPARPCMRIIIHVHADEQVGARGQHHDGVAVVQLQALACRGVRKGGRENNAL